GTTPKRLTAKLQQLAAALSADPTGLAAIIPGPAPRGNTMVTTTLSAPSTTVAVNDITGFQTVLNSLGQPDLVSSSHTLAITINGAAYTVIGATADGTNVSTSPMGVSGTLTTNANVSVADGTAGNTVLSGIAPAIFQDMLTLSGLSRLFSYVSQ